MPLCIHSIIHILLIMLLAISPACHNGISIDGMDIGSEEMNYPDAINEYISMYYASIGIEKVQLTTHNNTLLYKVSLQNGLRLYFNQLGHFLFKSGGAGGGHHHDHNSHHNHGDHMIEVSELPEVILEYILANYAGIDVVAAEIEFNGNYEVFLENGIQLYFDSSSNLLYMEDTYYYNNYYQCNHFVSNIGKTDIPISYLLEAIIDFIGANYNNSIIIQADELANGYYKVRISDGLELYFDENGTFLYAETEYRLSMSSLSLPDSVEVGSTVNMRAYIVNHDIKPFIGDIALPYDIADEVPENLQSATRDGWGNKANLFIAPTDSIEVLIPIWIDGNETNPDTYDVVIVWPEITNVDLVHPLVIGGHDYATTFVK